MGIFLGGITGFEELEMGNGCAQLLLNGKVHNQGCSY